MAPPRGPSLLADLRKEDLLFIFNTTLNGVPKLDKRKDKEDIKDAIRAEVAKEPVCNKHPCTANKHPAMLTPICGKKTTTCLRLQVHMLVLLTMIHPRLLERRANV